MLQARPSLLDIVCLWHPVGPLVLRPHGDHAVRLGSDVALHEHGHRVPVHVGQDSIGQGTGKVSGTGEQAAAAAQDSAGVGRPRTYLVPQGESVLRVL